MENNRRNRMAYIAIAGIVIVALILVIGTVWMSQNARKDTETAVHTVSLLYLDELAGRREQVVENNLRDKIDVIGTAVSLMTAEDLSDAGHLQAYQARMKRLFRLEKFAFVDRNGLIYTSQGTQTNIGDYHFDYLTLAEPSISILNLKTTDKKAVIAVPIDPLPFGGEELTVCFMEIDMEEMLSGISMEVQSTDATFCNIYTSDGVALSDTVLGGLAVEDNLLEALKKAEFHEGYSYEQVVADFAEGNRHEVSFTYNGIQETLSYVPVEGTNWLLTYLIREKVISDQISSVSEGIIRRGVIQSALTVAVLLAMFGLIFIQNRRNIRLTLETETAQAEVRGKQEELEQRIALQEKIEQQSQALSDALAAAEEANRAKTAFLSNMSHEIRTPMNAIIGLDSLALRNPELLPETRDYLERIGGSARHLLGLINDILDMSRIESGRMVLRKEEFSFRDMLEQINNMVMSQCGEKGLKYECSTAGGVSDYYIGDDMKLKQVLINILSNAIKFTDAPGRIKLTVERTAVFEDQATLKFTVKDTGIGMDKAFIPKIFDSFTQENSNRNNKYGSTGLGMAITKNIVTLMNGTISVESEKGVGSEFTVIVTLKTCDHQGPATRLVKPKDMHVLVVDDEEIAAEHARIILEETGIKADTCYSGQEALSMMEIAHTKQMPYNLVLLDWKMPEMDGLEVTQRIRQRYDRETTVIILTSFNWDEIMDEALHIGVDSFLAKPLFASSVIDEFERIARKNNMSLFREKKRADLKGHRILLAEDILINAEIIKQLIQMKEAEIDHAENGRAVLDLFRQSEPGYYDAILMDVRMPEMDGLEAAAAIRALDRSDAKTIPIIALTANAFDEDVQRSLQVGMNAHMSKPVEPEHLYQTLEELIAEKERNGGAEARGNPDPGNDSQRPSGG